jgi:hypothetical protein
LLFRFFKSKGDESMKAKIAITILAILFLVGLSALIVARTSADDGCLQPYTVKPGDRLIWIAGAYGLDWQVIAQQNHLVDPNLIYPGQVLCLSFAKPESTQAVVQPASDGGKPGPAVSTPTLVPTTEPLWFLVPGLTPERWTCDEVGNCVKGDPTVTPPAPVIVQPTPVPPDQGFQSGEAYPGGEPPVVEECPANCNCSFGYFCWDVVDEPTAEPQLTPVDGSAAATQEAPVPDVRPPAPQK